MANLVLLVPHQAQIFLRAPLRGGEALRAARAPGKLARSWWSGQQRARPPAGAGSGERARAACMGLREAAVGALRPNGSAGSTGGGRACWTWTRSGAGGRVTGRRRAWSRRGAGGAAWRLAAAAARQCWRRRRGAEKLRSRADAGRAAIEGELPPAPARSLHHSARPVKKRTLEERKSHQANFRTTIGTERKERTVQAQTCPI